MCGGGGAGSGREVGEDGGGEGAASGVGGEVEAVEGGGRVGGGEGVVGWEVVVGDGEEAALGVVLEGGGFGNGWRDDRGDHAALDVAEA